MNEMRERISASDPYDSSALVSVDDLSARARRITASAVDAPRSKARHGRVLLVAAGVAAVAVMIPIVAGPSLAPRASAEAISVLDRAIAEGDATDPAATNGQFWLVTTRGTTDTFTGPLEAGKVGDDAYAGHYVLTSERRTWTPVTGGQEWYDDRSEVTKVLRGPALGSLDPDVVGPRRETWTMVTDQPVTGGWQVPTPDFLASLPRDRDSLRDAVYDAAGGRGASRDGEAFVYIADVLRSGLVPADLRIALYRVLQTVPGVEVTDVRTTVMGRPGLALGRLEAVNGQRSDIVIDPATGEFVGERHERDGYVFETQVTRELVDAVPATIRKSARVDRCTTTDGGGTTCSAS